MQTIDAILSAGNLTQACRQVIRNKGAGGVDSMSVKELKPYLDKNRDELTELIRQGKYYPQPIRGKEIPKDNKKQPDTILHLARLEETGAKAEKPDQAWC